MGTILRKDMDGVGKVDLSELLKQTEALKRELFNRATRQLEELLRKIRTQQDHAIDGDSE